MSFPPARRAEAQLAVWTLEGLGSSVQAHVDLQTPLGREGVTADMAAEELLTCEGPRVSVTYMAGWTALSVKPVTQGLKGNRVPPPESNNSPALTTTTSELAQGMLHRNQHR